MWIGRHSRDLGKQSRSSTSSLPSLLSVDFALTPSLLTLFAARDAVEAKLVGGAEMEENRKVSRGVPGSKRQVRMVELVAAM